ncbi:MAG TPA: hypothetical protein DD640_10545 [Clostridiales bacterium]|nr:hypothetical protein [Clostridiales bacterium]
MARKKLYAAIDVGSHEVQMKIAELNRGEPPRMIENLRRTLAIGADTYTSGRISQPLLAECVEVLKGFTGQLKNYRIGACRTVATSAFREAQNRTLALDQIKRECDLDIEVLSNSEERYYTIMAAAGLMPDFAGLIQNGTLVVDMGAGSIQVTAFDKGSLIFSQNMLLGSLRIKEMLADLERRAADFAGLLEEYISGDLEDYRLLEPKGTIYKNLIILGGEINCLKRLTGRGADGLKSITGKQFSQIYRQLLASAPLDLSLENDIPPEHLPLLLPSVIIIRKFIGFTSADMIHIPNVTLCDGLLLDFARQKGDFSPGHDQDQDIISACRHLSGRFKTDRKHAEFVENTALLLFDETRRLHRLNERSRLLLQVSAILHDTGKYVSMTKHHVRSYQIVSANEIIGLSKAEQEIVAWTVRFHSGKPGLDDHNFTGLAEPDQLAVAQLAALLRLADALDSGHRQKITKIEASLEREEFVLSVTAGQDIMLELWNLDKKEGLFTEVYGLKPRIRIRRPQL